MSANRDKERDKAITREMILNRNRPPYVGGENWLGHGARDGKAAVIDNLLLDGATMERLLEERGTEASIRSHFQSLKTKHDLPVTRVENGRYRFDREHLGIVDTAAAASGVGMSPRDDKAALPEEIAQPERFFEGAVRTISVNAFERDPEACRKCIAHHGTSCCVCGFTFGVVYGPVAEGYIHVHHVRPLSEVRSETEVDPVIDMRPVCPNCHAVLHRRVPAYSVEEVRAFLRR